MRGRKALLSNMLYHEHVHVSYSERAALVSAKLNHAEYSRLNVEICNFR